MRRTQFRTLLHHFFHTILGFDSDKVTQVVDYYHATQRLNEIAAERKDWTTSDGKKWVERMKGLIRLKENAATPDVWQRLEPDTLSPQFRPYFLAGLLRYHCRHHAMDLAAATAARLTEQLAATPEGFYALECNLALAEYHQTRGEPARATEILQANLRLCQLAGAGHYEARTRKVLTVHMSNLRKALKVPQAMCVHDEDVDAGHRRG